MNTLSLSFVSLSRLTPKTGDNIDEAKRKIALHGYVKAKRSGGLGRGGRRERGRGGTEG